MDNAKEMDVPAPDHPGDPRVGLRISGDLGKAFCDKERGIMEKVAYRLGRLFEKLPRFKSSSKIRADIPPVLRDHGDLEQIDLPIRDQTAGTPCIICPSRKTRQAIYDHKRGVVGRLIDRLARKIQ